MDRKQWLTMVYREANLFIERNSSLDGKLTEAELDGMEPELHTQVQEVLRTCDSVEDVIKYSLLKDPSPDLWYGEGSWPRVLVSVASACLVHDVMGVARKILSGDLPKTPSANLHEAL